MSNALLAGVSGLKAYQSMLDVAGNNLANANTMGFKASRVSFAELLSQTLREASQPTTASGGTNPVQIGSGVALTTVDRLMTQGGLVNTGQDLDMAVEGKGYFVLNDGQRDVYTRSGSFAVDSQNRLVDAGTGYRVQRIGDEGVGEGFQTPGDASIRIPYDVSLGAKSTENIALQGNLSAEVGEATTHVLSSGMQFTAGSAPVTSSTKLIDLDQTANLVDGDKIHITGTNRQGTAVNQDFTIASAATATVGNLLTAISAAFAGSTPTIVNGEIRLTDDTEGYSKTDMTLTYDGGGTFELPTYFKIYTPGGQAVQNVDVEIFDSQGVSHLLSAAFVRTPDPNTWDFVLTSITGGVDEIQDRRVEGVTFLTDGSYGGLAGTAPDDPTFEIVFGNDPATTRYLNVNFGTVGAYDGVSLSGGDSTVAASGQDGYAAGQLSSVSVSREGVLVGLFTNGIRKDIASIRLAMFQNAAGLTAVGNNYYQASGNSGDPIPTKGLSGGAGAIRGGMLEKSNVESAEEFVNLIQAQNGYQANARTIRVANDMLRELANLIR